jgi:hypothetical protein
MPDTLSFSRASFTSSSLSGRTMLFMSCIIASRCHHPIIGDAYPDGFWDCSTPAAFRDGKNKRYPTQGSVNSHSGLDGFISIFFLNWLMTTRRASTSAS